MASKIYILPVKIDPAAITDAKKKNAEGISILPSDDEDESKKKLADLKTDLTAAILEKMKDAELPAQIWTSSSPVPADGWKLEGNVVNLDPGKKVLGISPFAKLGNMIAKGTGLQESMQIGRLADSVAEKFSEALQKQGLKKKED
jgi:hypothetical protein